MKVKLKNVPYFINRCVIDGVLYYLSGMYQGETRATVELHHNGKVPENNIEKRGLYNQAAGYERHNIINYTYFPVDTIVDIENWDRPDNTEVYQRPLTFEDIKNIKHIWKEVVDDNLIRIHLSNGRRLSINNDNGKLNFFFVTDNLYFKKADDTEYHYTEFENDYIIQININTYDELINFIKVTLY